MSKHIDTSNIYDKPITLDNLRKIWYIVRRTCKNKRAVQAFAINESINLYAIYLTLKNRKYVAGRFILFMILRPKERLVMSQHIADKIVNHFVANYYLTPYLERKLIDQNVATRKNYGTGYALKSLIKYINILNQNSEDIWCLKLDIRKYFYTIDHNILLNKFKERY